MPVENATRADIERAVSKMYANLKISGEPFDAVAASLINVMVDQQIEIARLKRDNFELKCAAKMYQSVLNNQNKVIPFRNHASRTASKRR